MTTRPQPLMTLTTFFLAALLLSGCATTRQTRSVEVTGFLGDYSMLEEGKRGEAQLLYIDESVDFSRYDSVMIDTVTIWYSERTKKLDPKDEQRLTDYFYHAIHEELFEAFRIVNEPGPNVLRVRAALTEARGARVIGNAVTSIVPQARLLATVGGAVTDVQVFVGRAAGEVEITDSMTGQRLVAAVDERSGTKAIRSGLLKWSDAKEIFEFWGERFRERLTELGVRKK